MPDFASPVAVCGPEGGVGATDDPITLSTFAGLVVLPRNHQPRAAMMDVEVELIGLRCRDGQLLYRVDRSSLRGNEHPDELALRLGAVPAADRDVVSHSTSWRADAGRIVLTYVLIPDRRSDLAARLLPDLGVVTSGDPARPTPHALHEHHVIAHAVRHLGYLHDTDSTIRRAARSDRDAWDLLLDAAFDIPVGLHADLHAALHPAKAG